MLVLWFAVAIAGLARAGGALPHAEPPGRVKRPLVRLVAGLGLLAGGGELLGEGPRHTVSRLGISETLLGNTAITAGVEAEEVGRVAVPARHGRDLAIANVVGTIVHFAAFNAGVLALVKPLTLDTDTTHLHLPVAVCSTALLVGLLLVRGGIRRRDGAFLIALYSGYVAAAIAIAA